MMRLGNNRMWQFYPMGSLPVLWCIDSNLDADTVHINEHFAGKMASPFWEVKKSGIGRERGLETLANYMRVKNVIIHIGRMG